jgi:hypothetical protein
LSTEKRVCTVTCECRAARWFGSRFSTTRLPGVIEVGRIYGDKKRFAAVHHDTPRGLRLVFEHETFGEWIVGAADPEAVVRTLRAT